MSIPQPGQPVRGSQTGRPIMVVLDLLGRRWILRILWELNQEALSFNALQRRCDQMSSSVLSQRLNELRQAHLVENAGQVYCLTEQGQNLILALHPLTQWAGDWAKNFQAGPATPGGEGVDAIESPGLGDR